jgi:hypothetical protein
MEKTAMAILKYKDQFNKDFFEKSSWENELLACGIDEVRRGCLAGPTVMGAAILFPNKKNQLLKDSNLISQKELQRAYQWLAHQQRKCFLLNQ